MAVDSSGNLYVAGWENDRIRKITPAGEVTTIAGSTLGHNDATGTEAQFFGPSDVAVDSEDGNLYVADTRNSRIRKITPAREVTTIAGSGTYGHHDATGTEAQFRSPAGVAMDSSGNVYVAEFFGNRIRKITSAGDVTTLAGSGTYGHHDAIVTEAEFAAPTALPWIHPAMSMWRINITNAYGKSHRQGWCFL